MSTSLQGDAILMEGTARYPIPPNPSGWYKLLYSDELAIGAIERLRYFGRDLVAYRGTDGKARVVAAYCRHVGAHLGFGGRVEGDTIVCPFHGWAWRGDDGSCAAVPYNPAGSRARLRHWETIERNGYIAVWHSEHRRPPCFEVPVITEATSDEYYLFGREKYIMRTHVSEPYENALDTVHFTSLHKMNVERVEWEPQGGPDAPIVRLTLRWQRESAAQSGEDGRTSVGVMMYGPGLQLTQLGGRIEGATVTTATPVDLDKIEVTFAFFVRRSCVAPEDEIRAFFQYYSDDHGLDREVWNHKIYLEQPNLVAGDGNIMKFRRWFRQFYELDEPVAAAAE